MSEYFTLGNGESLHVDEHGADAGSSSTLVALHGLGGGGYFFSGAGGLWARRFRVLCLDFPGSGFSPRGNRPITFERFVDAVVELIEGKTVGRVALLGHSMGTIISLKVYARIPHRIGKLIFVGGVPEPLPEAKARLRDRAGLARSAGMAAVAPTIVPVVFARRSLEAIADKVAMFERLLATSDAESYAETALALAGASAGEVVGRVGVPSLCVTGAEDRYAPPDAVKGFARSIPGCVYRELDNCAHMPFFEATEAFNGMVEDFVLGSGSTSQ
jgi:pimeloyl-ACP methyl ester carboxylesterase